MFVPQSKEVIWYTVPGFEAVATRSLMGDTLCYVDVLLYSRIALLVKIDYSRLHC